MDEGETVPAVEDVARPAEVAYFSRCALQFTQIFFSTLCSVIYKDATNNQNTINLWRYPFENRNTYFGFRTPGFASVHDLDPDAAFVPGAAKRNPVGSRSTAAMEKFCLLVEP